MSLVGQTKPLICSFVNVFGLGSLGYFARFQKILRATGFPTVLYRSRKEISLSITAGALLGLLGVGLPAFESCESSPLFHKTQSRDELTSVAETWRRVLGYGKIFRRPR